MPSRGNSDHEYLKKCAMKKCISIYAGSLDFLKHEQPQNQDETDDKNYFRVNVSLGSGWIDDIAADNLNFPDIVAQINLSDVERKIMKEGGDEEVSRKKFLVIECETKKTAWITDEKNPRHNSYHIIKAKHKEIVLILATFKDIKLPKSDLFDHIWRFPRK